MCKRKRPRPNVTHYHGFYNKIICRDVTVVPLVSLLHAVKSFFKETSVPRNEVQ
jgi:hypothetical protein